MERLDKILANMGEGSRTQVKEWIRRGCVLVDGAAVRSPEAKFDPDAVTIVCNGRNIRYAKFTYLMMYKAPGVLSATTDPRAETVLTHLPEGLQKRNLFPCGRLDKDAEGLLLLTNDGDAGHLLTSPVHHAPKTYLVGYSGQLLPDAEGMFERGVTIDGDTLCRPARLERLPENRALVTVHEGKFHQVKKMIAAVGGHVETLKRLTFGPLQLDPSLTPGDYRELTEEELHALMAFCGRA